MPRYRKIGIIGSGGFGEVHKVVRIEDDQEFAMKVLTDPALLDPSDVQRFKREVRLLRTLNHPRIVKIIDSHVAKEPYWFVMPLFRASLRNHLLTIKGDEARVRDIVMQLRDAMEYAHGNGVIHRDLKPENILCDDNGDIVVSDFGLGRRLDSPSTRKTYTGQFLGTPLHGS
jgi:serine/threonine protein kinase